MVDRYRSGTVKELAQPVFLCFIHGALVLRGVEKQQATKFGDWDATFHGELPFVFGYATGRTKIKSVPTS